MDMPVSKVSDIRTGGQDVAFNAWLLNMLVNNNLLHRLNPSLVASQDQLAFMVHLAPDQVYVPCSDETFRDLCSSRLEDRLRRQYARAWRLAMKLLFSMPYDRQTRLLLARFCRLRFRRILHSHTEIPSRVVKRLTSYVLTSQGELDDPWYSMRVHALERQEAALSLPHVREALDLYPADATASIEALNRRIGILQLARYACLAANEPRWIRGLPGKEELQRAFARAEELFFACLPKLGGVFERKSIILLLCDAAGGGLYDLCLAKVLTGRGHRVIYAVKDGFYFGAPSIRDVQEIPVLRKALKGTAQVCTERALSKNELLRLLHKSRLLVISDGTRERLNLARTSVTFARAWKEADLVLAHGWRLRDILLGTSHTFTRDILCWWQEDDDFHLEFRPRNPEEHKFSEEEIAQFADGIIARMAEARDAGRTVMFYSCVIGSIPGQTSTAIRVARAFVADLRARQPSAFIINPAEHFVEGMDGDDLMYMWERVQRSGLIGIWRFQTAEDIERSFALLGEEVPTVWLGKDATYSTGCTKEMRIAVDVQRSNPEMQIIGPDAARFSRRGDYGVGKYFDARLVRR